MVRMYVGVYWNSFVEVVVVFGSRMSEWIYKYKKMLIGVLFKFNYLKVVVNLLVNVGDWDFI